MPLDKFNDKFVTTVRTSSIATKTWVTSAIRPNIVGANVLTILLKYTRGKSSNCHIRVYTAPNTSNFYLHQDTRTTTGTVYLYDKTYIVTSAGRKIIPVTIHGERAAIAVRVSGASTSVSGNAVEIKAMIDRV